MLFLFLQELLPQSRVLRQHVDHYFSTAVETDLVLWLTSVPQMSWIELQREVESLSQLMMTWPDIQRGDRLGVIGNNSVEYLQVGSFSWVVFWRAAV